MLLMSTLPRQAAGGIDGALKVEGYSIALRRFPLPQIEFMVRTAIETCRWLPSPAECIAIAEKWQRHDDAVEARHLASRICRREIEARFDEIMVRLAGGDADQAEIDAMPDRWKQIAETRSLLWRHEDGSYSLRLAPQGSLGTPATSLDEITGAMAERFPSSQGRRDAA
jgi:hypothetical protein